MFQSWSRTQKIVYATLPMVSGFISFVASSTMITRILMSKTKLNKPNRRIIFVMSLLDLLAAISTLASGMPSPKGTTILAIGNQTTCSLQGFVTLAGLGSCLYSVYLAAYYLCIIKYDMRESVFSKKYEIYLHLVPNLVIWGSGITLTSLGYMNNAGYGCFIAPYPQGCVKENSCVRGHHAFVAIYFFAALALCCMVACTILMIFITSAAINGPSKKTKKKGNNSKTTRQNHHSFLFVRLVRKSTNADSAKPKLNSFLLKKKSNITNSKSRSKENFDGCTKHHDEERGMTANSTKSKVNFSSIITKAKTHSGKNSSVDESYDFGPLSFSQATRGTTTLKREHANSENEDSDKTKKRFFSRVSSLFSNPDSKITTRSERIKTKRKREIISQAIVFLLCVVGTYSLPIINRVNEAITGESPFWLYLLSRATYGLQGFFNVLVHTRPHIISLRKHKKTYSWFRAFIEILMAGGDNDGEGRGLKRSRRRISWAARHGRSTNPKPVTTSSAKRTRLRFWSKKSSLGNPVALVETQQAKDQRSRSKEIQQHKSHSDQALDKENEGGSNLQISQDKDDELSKIYEAAEFFKNADNDQSDLSSSKNLFQRGASPYNVGPQITI